MSIDKTLLDLKIKLPKPKDPVGSYLAIKKSNNLIYISGQISVDEKGDLITGKLGKDLNINQGYEAAQRCGLAIISQLKKACDNDLSKVKSCLKLTGYVNSTNDFVDQPKVINGASEIIVKIFKDKGLHTRAAISANSLPLGVAVEVDAVFEIN